MAGPATGEGRPDPDKASTAAEFVAALRRLKNWSGVGFRRLEQRAAAMGESLPRSTVTAALARDSLPREDLVIALARTCGCDETEIRRWVMARRRIAAAQPSPDSPTQPPTSVERDRAPRPARRTLPADQPVFVGRDKEIEQIITAVADAARSGGVIAIHAIDGMPGIGKTSLAVHVAHRLRDRFDDGQLFIDLHAHTPGQQPTNPLDVLAELLAAEAVDQRFLPATLDARSAMWRDRMAGRRLMLVLDDAANTEQVLPLLPGSADCLVLVTSRHSLGDLPVTVPVPLDVLSPDEAKTMFLRLAPRAAGDSERVADLVQACGYLPLAISIAASLYRRHRSWTMDDLLGEIRSRADGLLTMTAENRTVSAVFALSYHCLPQDRQRLFRLLGMHPGVDIDAYAAAALAGISLDEATAHLDALHAANMIDEPAYRRYRMHDLIRAYAGTLAKTVDPPDERDRAVRRLLEYYEHTAVHADGCLTLHTRSVSLAGEAPAAAPVLTNWHEAIAWLRKERANLFACVRHAIGGGLPAHAVGLTAGLAGLLRADGPWEQAIELHTQASAIARRLGDKRALATALYDQANVRRLADDRSGTAEVLDEALRLYDEIGDRLGRANILSERGWVHYLAGNYPAAAELHQQSLELYEAIGDLRGQGAALQGLGGLKRMTGDYPGAIDLLSQALPRYAAVGDLRGEATTLLELGGVRWLTGDYSAAADLLEQALHRYRTLGDRRGQGHSLQGLGVVRRLTGEYSAAADLLSQALSLHRDLGNPRGEAHALDDLGVVRGLIGDHAAAEELLDQAIQLHRTLGNRHSEAIASTHLATVKYQTGKYTDAVKILEDALAILRELDAPDDEAEALNHLGTVHRLTNQPERARALHQQAWEIARGIRHRLEEAHALNGIGRVALQEGDLVDAVGYLRQALGIYRELGVPEATRLVADLATIRAEP